MFFSFKKIVSCERRLQFFERIGTLIVSMSTSKIAYTQTDEAPALATHSLLPIVRAFTASSGIEYELKDISLAGRILSSFPENLNADQVVPDSLAQLGELATQPEANIIKLPNISASVPQLQDAIQELQRKGFAVPNFPTNPQTDQEKEIRAKYAKILGSAVNPVLREGNSDRRVAKPVKDYARKNPHSMGEWLASSKTHVSYMNEGDFFGSEQSILLDNETIVEIRFRDSDGQTSILKKDLSITKGEVIDASVMSCKSLRSFLAKQLDDARDQQLLFSIHMKATMMKVSDPIIFGHCVESYLGEITDEYKDDLKSAGFNPNNGLSDFYRALETLDFDKQIAIRNRLQDTLNTRPLFANAACSQKCQPE